MARVKDNVLVNGFSGKLEQVVFKTYSYGTVVTRYPDMSKVKRSKANHLNEHHDCLNVRLKQLIVTI